eukprot:TRINITY_DN55847_c0_g1_i1.p1 TRINITY_DN55847_c0_g1~~TRINITY_DN55847_c0_g1_i1.p1  ORF type:complete len:368 (-),score=87.59 TRINITY_DN55847_c0_g1_i1:145-1248(-)
MFSIIDMVKSAHVIINVAGPYILTQGEVLIDACIHLGTDYLDISGEIPWSLRVMDLHEHARQRGVFVVPSAASAGGIPDLGVYLCAKAMRETHGEELRHAACYQTGGGVTATASGGTLKTRAAMNEAGDDVRKRMADPFALGGFVPDVDRWGIKNVNVEFGTGKVTAKNRPEDMDVNFAKVSYDKKLGIWRGPFIYSYFDTRIVRRSNMLFADLGDCPYGRRLNFMEYALLPPEVAQASQATKAKSVEDERAELEAQGQYYKEGEGPPLEELTEAWTAWFLYADTESGHEYKLSMIGKDGYFETARVAVETAMCLRFDREKLQFSGGVLNATVAGGTFLARRLSDTGLTIRPGSWFEQHELKPPPMP